MKFAILVSDEAPELTSLVDAQKSGLLHAEFELVVSSNEEAPALQTAQKLGIPTMALSDIIYDSDPQLADEIIAAELKQRGIDYVLLCSYNKDVYEPLALSFKNRIIRVHPSLLPAFPGPHALEDVWISGVKVSGASVHFVNQYGQALIISQKAFEIAEGESLSGIKEKTQMVIAELLPQTLSLLVEGRVHIKADGTVAIREKN